tara:strand:- start:117 stop:428 length:312 start_codon:yes stop_codon:yes gene_type:complete
MIRNDQFVLPITKNRIKAIDKMEEEFYKTRDSIKDMLSAETSTITGTSEHSKELEEKCALYKRQAKYYKSMWISQKKEIEELGAEVRNLREISEILVKKKINT